ncbi:MAG: hypothetical protein HYT07_00755 [Candidatus Levybacteria bacterium]|nr:hypothetical protein [Candidatus Levybacteria bacterium]
MNRKITAMDNKLPDWEIGKLYNQAWNIIKKYKVLWIFGLASGASLSFNFNLPFNFNSDKIKDVKENFQSFPGEIASGGLTQVLGASDSQVLELLSNLFSSVPFYFYIILAIEIITVFILAIIIGIISKAWSTGLLLEGVQTSILNGIPNIRDSSEKAFSHTKSLAWLQTVPPLVLAVGFLTISIIIFITIIIPTTIVKILLGLLSIITFGVVLYGSIYYLLSEIWASRIVVLEKKSGKESLFRGYKIARKKTWAMILLGLVNIILSMFILAIPVLIIIGIIFGGMLTSGQNQSLGIGLFVIGAILVIPMIIAMILLGGILNAFKATVWSIAYNNIRGKYDPSTSSGSE